MPTTTPKTSKGKKAAVTRVMDEWKAGKLHAGNPQGPVVKKQQQAIAIALSESGQSTAKKKKAKR